MSVVNQQVAIEFPQRSDSIINNFNASMKKQQDPDLLNVSGSRESIVNVFNASLKKQQDADHLTISNSEGEVISPVKMKENFKQIITEEDY